MLEVTVSEGNLFRSSSGKSHSSNEDPKVSASDLLKGGDSSQCKR